MNASLRKKLCAAAMAGLAGTVGHTSYAGVWIGPTGDPVNAADWFTPANWAGTDASGVPGDGLPAPSPTDDTLAQFTANLPAGDYVVSIPSSGNLTPAAGGSFRYTDFVNPTHDHSG
jgi:hypothetical protein